MWKADFRRAFSWQFIIAAAIGVAVLFSGVIDQLFVQKYMSDVSDCYGAIQLATDALGRYGSAYYGLIAPFLCVLPYTVSYCSDKLNGAYIYQMHRTTRLKFSLSRFITNSLAGGCVILFSQIMFFLLLLLRLKIDVFQPGMFEMPFGMVYMDNPMHYYLIILGITFLFGMAYSALGMAISSYIENRYVAFFAPFIFFYGISLILLWIPRSFSMILPLETITICRPQPHRGFEYILQLLLIFFSSVALFFLKVLSVRRRNV